MISFLSKGPNGKPILASLGLVGLAIMIHWCYLDFELSSLKNGGGKKSRADDGEGNSSQDRSVDDEIIGHCLNDETKRGGDDSKELLFPWEPNYVPKGSQKNILEKENLAGSSFNAVQCREIRTTKRHKEELDFLASMTFANGGLRSPSCPCCV